MKPRRILRWALGLAGVAVQVALLVVIHLLGREASAWDRSSVVADPVLADLATGAAFLMGCVLASVWVVDAERRRQLALALDAAAAEVGWLADELAKERDYSARLAAYVSDAPVARRPVLTLVPDVDATVVDPTLVHAGGAR